MNENEVPTNYEFRSYQLLTAERLLLRSGRPIPLAPKVFETLLAFVRNSGRLLSKAELMKLIWDDTVVEEGNLTQNIFVLRKILGETPQDHKYLVTIPLQGYRFVAPVREVPPGTQQQKRDQQSSGMPAIAVLPFSVINAQQGVEFEGLGIADTLITKLNGLREILVRPTSAVIKYANYKDDLRTIGSELAVDSLLHGTIQHSGDRIRVNVQLSEVQTGRIVWAEKYDEKYSDIFGVQDSIASRVAASLQVRLSSDELQHLTKSHTENLDAYQLYVKGRYFWETRTEQGLTRALEYAQKSVELDDQDAMAYVGVADSYAFLGEYLYLAPADAFQKAKSAAERARQLDGNLAEAYASLAEVNFFYDWDWSAAERNYKTAIGMKPNYASAHHWYAWFLMATGRFDEALSEIRKAQVIDPGSLTHNTVLGLPFYYEGYYEQAVAQFRNTLEMNPGFMQARYYLGSALAQLGRLDEAIAEFEMVRPAEYWQQTSALLTFVYARSGQRSKARKVLKELEDASGKQYISPYLKAIAHAGLNEDELVFESLERGLQQKAAWMVFLAIDPFLKHLREQRHFLALLQRLRLAPAIKSSDVK